MKCWSRMLICAGACLLVVSCAQQKSEQTPVEKESDEVKQDQLVGRVASVHASAKRVLIQHYGSWKVPQGELLYTMSSDGTTANLTPTGQRLGQFVAADLRGGTCQVGDGVWWRQIEGSLDEEIEKKSDPTENAMEADRSGISGSAEFSEN